MCDECMNMGCASCDASCDFEYIFYNPFDEEEKKYEKEQKEIKIKGLAMMKEYIASKNLAPIAKEAMEHNCLGMIEIDQFRVYSVADCAAVFAEMSGGFPPEDVGCECEGIGLPPGSTCRVCGDTRCGYCDEVFKKGVAHLRTCTEYNTKVETFLTRIDTIIASS